MNGKEAYKIFEDTRLSRPEFCAMVGLSTATLQGWKKRNADVTILPSYRDKILLIERALKAGRIPEDLPALMRELKEERPSEKGVSDLKLSDIEPGFEFPVEEDEPKVEPEIELARLRNTVKTLREKLEMAADRLSVLMEDTMDLNMSLKELKKILEALSKD